MAAKLLISPQQMLDILREHTNIEIPHMSGVIDIRLDFSEMNVSVKTTQYLTDKRYG